MIRLAIDIGSYSTKIYMIGGGVVLCEATCVAVESDGKGVKCRAFGNRAKAICGKAASGTEIVYPVKEGGIDSPDLLAELMRYFLEKIEIKPSHFKKCDVLFVLPCGYTKELKERYIDLARAVGIGRISFTALPNAAIIGHSVKLTESRPVFCLDIGYGVCNIAVLTLDGIISGFSLNLGSGNMDVRLVSHLAETYGIKIGPLTAERLKITIGNLLEGDEKLTVVEGNNVRTGAPMSVALNAYNIKSVITVHVDKILEYVELVINRLPAEVSSEVTNAGIYLSGGGAKIDGLREYIEDRLSVPVNLSPDPVYSSVIGAGTIFSSDALYDRLTFADE
ncbi:MAG: rod shape-determining protein [Clostridia bacterium]|nr:rod shape-determining protein [Clostridia bacterium]